MMEQAARERLGMGILRLALKQAWSELKVELQTRLTFRRRQNAEALRAYCAMSGNEFDGINARQRWANWRTIPGCLRGRLPDGPCRAVDLCSGAGDSTEVLAYYLPPGSEILGLEYNPVFVEKAGRRCYLDSRGLPVKTSFRAQSVVETFRGASGEALPSGSMDLVNCCGALGHHFDADLLGLVAAETYRVLKPGGLAAVDSGTQGVGQAQMTRIFQKRGFEVLGSARSCWLDRSVQICFRRGRG